MSARALFLPGAGDFHIPVTVRLADLPRGQKLAAWLVYSAVVNYLRAGNTELGERYTDRVLQQSPWLRGFSLRFIQKGLRILTNLGLIKRIPSHGRRRIIVTGRLRGRPKPQPRAQAQAGTKGQAKPKKPPGRPNPPAKPATPQQLAAAARIAAQAQAQHDPDEPKLPPMTRQQLWDTIEATAAEIPANTPDTTPQTPNPNPKPQPATDGTAEPPPSEVWARTKAQARAQADAKAREETSQPKLYEPPPRKKLRGILDPSDPRYEELRRIERELEAKAAARPRRSGRRTAGDPSRARRRPDRQPAPALRTVSAATAERTVSTPRPHPSTTLTPTTPKKCTHSHPASTVPPRSPEAEFHSPVRSTGVYFCPPDACYRTRTPHLSHQRAFFCRIPKAQRNTKSAATSSGRCALLRRVVGGGSRARPSSSDPGHRAGPRRAAKVADRRPPAGPVPCPRA